MADDILESNIVIKTKMARPNREGFLVLKKDFDEIENRLTKLTSKPWVIKIQVDDSDLVRYNIAAKKAPGTGPAAAGPPSSPRAPVGPLTGLGTGAGVLSRRVTTVQTEEGASVTIQEKRQQLAKQQLITETNITDQHENQKKLIQEELNLKDKVLTNDRRRQKEAAIRAEEQARRVQFGKELGQTVRADIQAGQFPLTMEKGDPSYLQEGIFASERAAARQRKIQQKEIEDEDKALEKIFYQRLATQKALAKKEAAEKQKAANEAAAAAKAATKEKERLINEEDQALERIFNRNLAKRKQQEAQLATAQQRQDRRESKGYLKEFERTSKKVGIQGAVDVARGEGFVELPSVDRLNVITGALEKTRQLARTTGNAFEGYKVELVSANEATGQITQKMLTGSAAMRYLGDSFVRATAKVLLWTAATSAIFGTVAAITEASKAILELEENTVLLARVGREFAGGSLKFEKRKAEAEELTNQIIELTTVYGGLAVEAQRAATIFARAGQDKEETLLSVRAALLAARIAELDTVEASNLLSAAYLQFNLKAKDLLPTLDSLNSLSNNYRVTTNDLLQSISRTGAVFSDHHGRLTELAAITAVVSQVTSRSGAEIGNALKTISSNLDRLDIQASILDKLGISTVNFAGESKSLGQVLLEIQTRLSSLNVTEQRQITLQIAGVRQRNILLASIKEASNALIAENLALSQAGSAQEEFNQRASTTKAALERLSAVFVQIAKLGGEGLNSFFRQFLNIITYLLKFLTLLNGLPVKIAVTTVAFLLLTRGIQFLGTQLLSMSFSAGVASSALDKLAASTTAAGVATAYAFPLYGVLTLTLIGLTLALGNAAEKQNLLDKSIEGGITNAEQNVIAEEKRRQALKNSTEAMARLIQEYQRLKTSGKPGDQELAERVKERALDIAKSANIKVNPQNLNVEDLAKEARRIDLQLIEDERVALDRLLALKIKEQIVARTKFDRESLRAYNAPTYEDYQHEQNKLLQEEEEIREKILGLTHQQFDLNQKGAAFDRANNALKKDRERIEERALEKKERGFETAIAPETATKELEASYKVISKDTDTAVKNLNEMLDLTIEIGTAQYQDDIKRVNKLLDERLETLQKLRTVQIANVKETATALLGVRSSLVGRAAQIGLSRERGLSNASQYGDEFAKIQLERQQQLDRIAQAQRIVAGSKGGGNLYQIGATQAAREETQAAITRLKELEADKAIAILEAEKQIALERKKSADEAARALGTLSDEDKLRVRAQAQYFAARPGEKVSIGTQFGTDAKSNQLLQQFFAGNLETLTESKSGLATALGRTGFGRTEAIAKGEAELAAARGGRTDLELMNTAIENVVKLQEQLLASQGRPAAGLAAFAAGAYGVAPGRGVTGPGAVDTRLSITATAEKLDLQPITEAFENVVKGVYQEAITQVGDEMRLIIKQERALNLRNKPQTAVSPAD